MELQKANEIVSNGFKYQHESNDLWRVLNTEQKYFYGDCEDYGFTVLWLICNKNLKIFIDAIVSGKKTYEGRVYTGFWKNLNLGSRFQITDGLKIQEVEVEQLLYFNNFGDAWFTLQDRLIPNSIKNIVVREDAVKLYSKYYSEDEIQKKLHITCV